MILDLLRSKETPVCSLSPYLLDGVPGLRTMVKDSVRVTFVGVERKVILPQHYPRVRQTRRPFPFFTLSFNHKTVITAF